MALTIRLDEDEKSYLTDFMKNNLINTASKAIAFMIRDFPILQEEKQKLLAENLELQDKFDQLVSLISEKSIIDKQINSYLYK